MMGPNDHEKLEKFHNKIKAGDKIPWEKVKGLSEFEQNILSIIQPDFKEIKSFWLDHDIVVYLTGVKDAPYCCIFYDRLFIWFDENDSIHPDKALQIGLSREGIDSRLIIKDDGTSILEIDDITVVDERRKKDGE